MIFKGIEVPHTGNRYVYVGKRLFHSGPPNECFWGGPGPGTFKLAEKILKPLELEQLSDEFANEVLAMLPNRYKMMLTFEEVLTWIVQHQTD